MTKLVELWVRLPRIWLFAVAGFVQVALIALMVADRVRILRTGTEVVLKTRAVDPRDLLRGDYVVLNYDISSVSTGDLKDTLAPRSNFFMYVKLAPTPDGFHQAVSIHRDRVAVAAGEVLIRGRVSDVSSVTCGADRKGFCSSIQLNYGLESFFVPQGEGRDLEKARNEGKLAVVAAVAPGGRAAIKRLLLDGMPVYDEPLF